MPILHYCQAKLTYQNKSCIFGLKRRPEWAYCVQVSSLTPKLSTSRVSSFLKQQHACCKQLQTDMGQRLRQSVLWCEGKGRNIKMYFKRDRGKIVYTFTSHLRPFSSKFLLSAQPWTTQTWTHLSTESSIKDTQHQHAWEMPSEERNMCSMIIEQFKTSTANYVTYFVYICHFHFLFGKSLSCHVFLSFYFVSYKWCLNVALWNCEKQEDWQTNKRHHAMIINHFDHEQGN